MPVINTCSPVILSVSRRTDIPAFYARWFENRWKSGFCKVANPYNGKMQTVLFDQTRLIVFWTKNAEPIFSFLKTLDAEGIAYYFLYSLNDYENEGLEPFVPGLKHRIETFKKLSETIGPARITWRLDPLVLSAELNVEKLLQKAKKIGDQLKPYTNKMIFSFVETDRYRKVKRNLNFGSYREFTEQEKTDFVSGLSDLNKTWNFDEISCCASPLDFSTYGITKGKCIDHKILLNGFRDDVKLQEIAAKAKKDKGQRKECRCIESKDIGKYNTCLHDCKYCYAIDFSEKPKNFYQNFDSLSESL